MGNKSHAAPAAPQKISDLPRHFVFVREISDEIEFGIFTPIDFSMKGNRYAHCMKYF